MEANAVLSEGNAAFANCFYWFHAYSVFKTSLLLTVALKDGY